MQHRFFIGRHGMTGVLSRTIAWKPALPCGAS
jgi:hypothetical protein